ncbi:MAG: histidine phosphatase family protein [Chlamydiae bacterium CG10_big_fil_rev_8_21_14_0_10_35_9]|nr:MAG: histidine phosphatase family protein [Chlamydiae bacterium CG10_big_fil_rev_8_21_14_0_10_35_9]
MQKVYLARHGQTKWNQTKQHTSFTDIALNEEGKQQARLLKHRLEGTHFEKVFTSPLLRASTTCELAGFQGEPLDELKEWNYGDYEGKTTNEIKKSIPDWTVFTHGAPNGESIEQVTTRAYKFFSMIEGLTGNILLFSHGHFSRALIACWLQLSAREGRFFILSNASLSILGYERKNPVIELLNDTSYLKG